MQHDHLKTKIGGTTRPDSSLVQHDPTWMITALSNWRQLLVAINGNGITPKKMKTWQLTMTRALNHLPKRSTKLQLVHKSPQKWWTLEISRVYSPRWSPLSIRWAPTRMPWNMHLGFFKVAAGTRISMGKVSENWWLTPEKWCFIGIYNTLQWGIVTIIQNFNLGYV